MKTVGTYTVSLTANDVNVEKISSFEFNCPAGNLGSRLDVRVADLGAHLHAHGSFDFSITWGEQTINLISNGRVVGRKLETAIRNGQPDDKSLLTAIDPLGDKWSISPRIPLLLYDPDKYSPVVQGSELHGDIRDINNNVIGVQYQAVKGLDLLYALNFVFVQQLGFSGVITNLETYGIRYIPFQIQNSYFDAVKPLAEIWEPEYFIDSNNNVNIIDPNAQLPAGLIDDAKSTTAKKYISINQSVPFKQLINAVLLGYQEDALETSLDLPSDATTVTETDTNESGVAGEAGYQRTQRDVTTVQFRDDPSNPTKITRTVQTAFKIQTWSTVPGVGVQLVKVETQTDSFEQNFRINTGYVKTIDAYTLLPDGAGPASLVSGVMRETCVKTWAPSDYTPDVWVEKTAVISQSGIVLIDSSDPADLTAPRYPILDAFNQKIIVQDGSQVSLSLPIRTSVEHTRELGNGTGSGQVEKHIDGVNQLTGASERSDSIQGIGSSMVQISRWRTLQVLIQDDTSTDDPTIGPRKPVSLNAGEVPYPLALALAQRKLRRASQPPYEMEAQLAAVDFHIYKGAIRQVFDRLGNPLQDASGNPMQFLVTSFSIKGSDLGTSNAQFVTSWRGIQLLST